MQFYIFLFLLSSIFSVPFKPQHLIEWPRIQSLQSNPFGDKGLLCTTSYSISSQTSTQEFQLISYHLQSDPTFPMSMNLSIPFNKLDAKHYFWLNDEYIAYLNNHNKLMMIKDNIDQMESAPSTFNTIEIADLSTFKDIKNFKYHYENNTLFFSAITGVYEEDSEYGDSGMVYDQLFVRHWDKFITPNTYRHLFKVELDVNNQFKFKSMPEDIMYNTKLECPSYPFGDTSDFSISPNDKQVIFISKPYTKDMAWSTTSHVYTIDLINKGIKCINCKGKGASSNPIYSSNGKLIAWLEMKRAQYEADKNIIKIYNTTSGKIKKVNIYKDVSPISILFNNENEILFLAEDYGYTKLFKINIHSKLIKRIDNYKMNFESMQLLSENKLLIKASAMSTPPEYYLVNVDGFNNDYLYRQTDITTTLANNIDLLAPKEIWYKGGNNEYIHSWLLEPKVIRPWLKYPIITLIHGGPQLAWLDSWNYRWNANIFANLGYYVFMVNYHGSTGFGQNFTDSIKQHWGKLPYTDIQLGLEKVYDLYPKIDKKRICALGGSQGGYLVNYINGQTDKFRCLVNHDGIFDNLMSYYTADELYTYESDFDGTPFNHLKRYKLESPDINTWKWSTPTLVIHSNNDFRVNFDQGLATFTALQKKNVYSKLLYFPDEYHWIGNRRWHYEVINWIDRYLYPYKEFNPFTIN